MPLNVNTSLNTNQILTSLGFTWSDIKAVEKHGITVSAKNNHLIVGHKLSGEATVETEIEISGAMLLQLMKNSLGKTQKAFIKNELMSELSKIMGPNPLAEGPANFVVHGGGKNPGALDLLKAKAKNLEQYAEGDVAATDVVGMTANKVFGILHEGKKVGFVPTDNPDMPVWHDLPDDEGPSLGDILDEAAKKADFGKLDLGGIIKAEVHGAVELPGGKAFKYESKVYPLNKMSVDPCVKLIDATKLYQPVHGTGQGSRYFVVGLAEGLAVAARILPSLTVPYKLSIRVEGYDFKKYNTVLNELGYNVNFDIKYASVHVDCPSQTAARMALAAMVFGIGVDFVTPAPNLKVLLP